MNQFVCDGVQQYFAGVLVLGIDTTVNWIELAQLTRTIHQTMRSTTILLMHQGDFKSDTGPLNELTKTIFDVTTNVHSLKDPTPSRVATALNEIAKTSGVTIAIKEDAILVREQTRGACEILGIDPLYIAN